MRIKPESSGWARTVFPCTYLSYWDVTQDLSAIFGLAINFKIAAFISAADSGIGTFSSFAASSAT